MSRLSSRGHGFSVAGPATWNGLPVTLRQIPVHQSISFLSALKTNLFDRVGNLERGAIYNYCNNNNNNNNNKRHLNE